MTTRELQTLTVPQLRGLCKKAGLPSWQIDGVRLTKPSLIAQIARVMRRKPKSKRRRPAKVKQRQTAPQPRETGIVDSLAEQLIARMLEEMPSDVATNLAMKRILRGGMAVKDRTTLQRRRLSAIQLLQRGAPDDQSSEFWSAKHLAELNIAGC